MEYCQLSDLAHFMKKREQLATLPETRDIFHKYPNTQGGGIHHVIARHFLKQIASALKYLRSRNLIHRDVKPQNLLLNPSPAYMAKQRPEDNPLAASEHSLIPAVGLQSLPMLKIADFGFARHLPTASLAETLCGSPLYMAPEILSFQKYDAIVDIWSVGTVTYEMLVGKPPWRANNHVELLRNIDAAHDVVPYPRSLTFAPDLKRLINSMLKRNPLDRLSFEDFFTCPPVINAIPDLASEDMPQTASAPVATRTAPKDANVITRVSTADQSPSRSDVTAGKRPSSGNGENSTGPASPVPESSRTTMPTRPIYRAHTTAPAREHVSPAQYSLPNEISGIKAGINTHAYSTSVPKQTNIVAPRVRRTDHDRSNDMAFEKEYVLIEKRAVEVNAFADELAAVPQAPRHNSADHGAMVRRVTSPNTQVDSNASQNQSARRTSSINTRQTSYDRRQSSSATSATNMLSKALNMANARLYGMLGASPPTGYGISPPRGYGAYPAYSSPTSGLAITDGRSPPVNVDEDTKVLRTVEEAASRSDTVYSFAQVKFRQLLPATPSTETGSDVKHIGHLDASLDMSDTDVRHELTQMALVNVSEEALVLFVKALAILAKSIDLAGKWWLNQKRGEADARPANPEVSKRMNNVVQWARSRFNECLEKSDLVGRRLVDAQNKLPANHQAHPNNQTQLPRGNNLGTTSEPILLTSGITAEKLMFERAVDMSRQAAINELIDEDLPGCEISYRTAIMLMEAVLERDDEPLLPRPSANKDKSPDEPIIGLETEGRNTVINRESSRLRVTTNADLFCSGRRHPDKATRALSKATSTTGS